MTVFETVRGGRVPSYVSYRVRRGEGRSKIRKGAFIPPLDSGYHGVFFRRGRSRLDWRELFGPSVQEVARKDPKVQQLLESGAQDVMNKNLRSQLLSIDRSVIHRGKFNSKCHWVRYRCGCPRSIICWKQQGLIDLVGSSEGRPPSGPSATVKNQ